MNTSTDPDTQAVPAAPASQRLAERVAGFLGAHTSRRGFIARTAVIGSALAVNPGGFVLRPGTAYAAVCGPAPDCAAGYTAFCCTTNGANQCPPGTFVGGWWKADGSSYCCGGPRYYIDCQNSCTGCSSGCGGYNSFCSSACINGSCHCASGSCDQRRVSCNYFRYGQCHQEIGCGGPVACRVVSCTPPYELFGECSNASATDNATAEHSAPCLPGGCPGAIEQHYYDLGGPGSLLGAQLTGEMVAPDGAGRFTNYQNGAIYWTPGTGAWEVHGAIKLEWAATGWERGPLGYPVTDELPTPDGVGRFNHFQASSIYWTPDTGAHEVHGAVRASWAASGWERGPLGYPLTDETPTPDGRGRYNHFQAGSIYWTAVTGARIVRGEIHRRWAELGWERSPLGYPLTDELGTPDGRGRFNHFEGGSVYWSPASGGHVVYPQIRDRWAALEWETGLLGYPVTDDQPTPDGGRYAGFQGGWIYRGPTTAAHEVHGQIALTWAGLGALQSRLGYPVTDEYAVPGGRASDFEHGRITWNAATGATTVTYS
jgi:hypothetical protein